MPASELARAFDEVADELEQLDLATALRRVQEWIARPDAEQRSTLSCAEVVAHRLTRGGERGQELATALARDPTTNENLRVSIVEGFGDRRFDGLVVLAPALLADPSPLLRLATVSTLGRLGAPQTIAPLIEALEDEAMVYSMWAVLRVMDMAALALQQGQWGRERERAQAAVRAWADRRAMELESEHRQHAALSLGAIADPRAIEPLFERVPDGDLQALELLADIGTPEIVVRLSAMLAELADDAAVQVAQTLGQIGDPACIPALEAMLADTDSSARWAAARGLHLLDHLDAWAVLDRYTEDPDPRVREYAEVPPPIRELLSRSSQVRSGR